LGGYWFAEKREATCARLVRVDMTMVCPAAA
jgi:hypothetical protein